MLRSSTITLLRFHFSLFLLPVFLFALSEVPDINWKNALIIFIILHLLVYPSSNGYNSYMDRDTTPIGGLEHPPLPTKQLFRISLFMDISAVLLSLLVSLPFTLGTLLYILASRAYSYRDIRLKRFPVTGFLTVFVFQGALIFFITWHGVHPQHSFDIPLIPCLISSLLIGALYPLTQIYQHEEDLKDGVRTISYAVGKKGTFILSGFLFGAATFLLFIRFQHTGRLNHFYLFLLVMLPVVLFFIYWLWKVWKNDADASFGNSLRMNLLSTICTTVFFLVLIIQNH